MAISKKALIVKILLHLNKLQRFLPLSNPLLVKFTDQLNELPMQVLRNIYSKVKSLELKVSKSFQMAIKSNIPELQIFLMNIATFQKNISSFQESDSRQNENSEAVIDSLNIL